jgi:hypothetical protein
MNTPTVNARDGAGQVSQKWYTARSIHATGTSRGYANFDLKVGDLVVLDPYSNTTGHELQAIGTTVAVPTLTWEHLPHYVVLAVHPGVNQGVSPTEPLNFTGRSTGVAPNPRAGGWIDVASVGVMPAAVLGANIAVGDQLVVTPAAVSDNYIAQASLQEIATTAMSDATTSDRAEVAQVMARTKAVALQTYDSGSVIGYKTVALGGLGGSEAA